MHRRILINDTCKEIQLGVGTKFILCPVFVYRSRPMDVRFLFLCLHHRMKGIRTPISMIDGSTLPQGCVKEQLCWSSVGHEVIGFIKNVMKKSDLVRSQSM